MIYYIFYYCPIKTNFGNVLAKTMQSVKIITLRLFFIVLFLTGLCFLQYCLSKRREKWIGYVLPAITFSISLIVLLFFNAEGYFFAQPFGGRYFFKTEMLFVLCNIPTALFLAVHFIVARYSRKKGLDKMKLQDL